MTANHTAHRARPGHQRSKPSTPAKLQPSQPPTGKSFTGQPLAAFTKPASRSWGDCQPPKQTQPARASKQRIRTLCRTFWAPGRLLV